MKGGMPVLATSNPLIRPATIPTPHPARIATPTGGPVRQLGQARRHHAGDAHHRSGEEVDAARYDYPGHAQCDEADNRHLPNDVDDVDGGEERRRQNGGYRHHQAEGFRSYLRELAPSLELLEPIATLESESYAYQGTLDLLKRTPELVGLYVAGGGVEGVMRGLAETGNSGRMIAIGHDLTDRTRAGLISGTLQVVLSHPLKLLSERAVGLMARLTGAVEDRDRFTQDIVPFEIFTPENL